MKKIILTLTALGIFSVANAQQIIESSQYMNNDYLFNTAIAGTKANMRVSAGVRKQWLGFDQSPMAQNLTFQGRVGKSIGLGAQVYNDTWGLSRRTGINLGVNYILPLSEKMDLSLGVVAITNQFSIDREKAVTEQPDDIALYNGIQNQLFPDAGFSAYLNAETFYVGASVVNLIEVKNDILNNINSQNYLNRTAYFTAGARFSLSDKIDLEPSAIAGLLFSPSILQYQVDVRGVYNDFIWLGVGYRDNADVIVNLGVYIKTFTIGYSADFQVGALGNNVGSSHELFLAFDIVKSDSKASWFKRNRVYNQNRR